MKNTLTRLSLPPILAALSVAFGLAMAALLTPDLLLIAPVYLLGLSGTALSWFQRRRALKIVGFVVTGLVVALMLNIGLTAHEILGYSLLTANAAMLLYRKGAMWMRFAAGALGFLLGMGPLSALNQLPEGFFRNALLTISLLIIVTSVLILVLAFTETALRLDGLGAALLLTAVGLATGGLLSFLSIGLQQLDPGFSTEGYQESAAFWVETFNLLGMRFKDVIMAVLLPIILGIAGVIRISNGAQPAREQSQDGSLVFFVLSAVAIVAQVLNIVVFALMDQNNPLFFASPLVNLSVLLLWFIAVVAAWRTFTDVRTYHLPGNTLTLSSRIMTTLLLLTPALGGALEFGMGIAAI